jgi:hypothetical protein
MPKELMPATRVPRALAGQSSAWSGKRNGRDFASKDEFSDFSPAHGASRPCRMASSTLMSEQTPEAASMCPRLALVPMAQNCCAPVDCRTAFASACSSIGSPSSVPAPWLSM